MIKLTTDQEESVRRVLSGIESQKNYDPQGTLDYFLKMYVIPLKKNLDISKSVLLDCGCGTGFLSHSYLLAGGRHVIAADYNPVMVKAATQIGEALGVSGKVDYINCSLVDLPFPDKSVDALTSIETLEHVGEQRYTAVSEMNRVTKSVIMLSTPNLWFPVIAHDTRLPFAHWLPLSIRAKYAALFGRADRNKNNLFISPRKLKAGLSDFERTSKILMFDNLQEWQATYPLYLPYGGHVRNGRGAWVTLGGGWKGRSKLAYYSLLSRLGSMSEYTAHNLSGLYRAKNSN